MVAALSNDGDPELPTTVAAAMLPSRQIMRWTVTVPPSSFSEACLG